MSGAVTRDHLEDALAEQREPSGEALGRQQPDGNEHGTECDDRGEHPGLEVLPQLVARSAPDVRVQSEVYRSGHHEEERGDLHQRAVVVHEVHPLWREPAGVERSGSEPEGMQDAPVERHPQVREDAEERRVPLATYTAVTNQMKRAV
jgi:hypothetical protein